MFSPPLKQDQKTTSGYNLNGLQLSQYQIRAKLKSKLTQFKVAGYRSESGLVFLININLQQVLIN